MDVTPRVRSPHAWDLQHRCTKAVGADQRLCAAAARLLGGCQALCWCGSQATAGGCDHRSCTFLCSTKTNTAPGALGNPSGCATAIMIGLCCTGSRQGGGRRHGPAELIGSCWVTALEQ